MKSCHFFFLSFAAGLVAEYIAQDSIPKSNDISAISGSSSDIHNPITFLNVEARSQKPPPTTAPKPANSPPKPTNAPPKPANPPPKPANSPPKPASPPPKPASPPSKPASPPARDPPQVQVAAGKILNSPPPKGTVGRSTGGQCLKPRLPGKRSPANACSGLHPKRFVDLDEFPSSNSSSDVFMSKGLFKRADQYFWMDEGPQGLYWGAEASTLYTDRVCGCSIVYIASPEAGVGIHIAPTLKKADGTVDSRIEPKDFAKVHVKSLVTMSKNMAMTNRKAVAFVADPSVMSPVAEAIKQEIRRANIPITVYRYSYDAMCQLPNGAGSSVTSVAGTMPACAAFNGQAYNWPA